MDMKQLISSGLLELYVLGRLDPQDTKLVEDAMSSHIEVRQEIQDIERAFEAYARIHGVIPSDGLKSDILKALRNNMPEKPIPPGASSGKFPWLATLLSIIALALALGWFQQNQKIQDLRDQNIRDQIICDSITQAQQNQISLLNQINDVNNDIIPVTPTEKYPATDLYFHHNPVSQTNYIQVKNLPAINANQSYQLWSLKADQAPIPMDVFRAEDGSIMIPVGFEINTNTYAITIEQLGGASSPNLADLIGTFTIS